MTGGSAPASVSGKWRAQVLLLSPVLLGFRAMLSLVSVAEAMREKVVGCLYLSGM